MLNNLLLPILTFPMTDTEIFPPFPRLIFWVRLGFIKIQGRMESFLGSLSFKLSIFMHGHACDPSHNAFWATVWACQSWLFWTCLFLYKHPNAAWFLWHQCLAITTKSTRHILRSSFVFWWLLLKSLHHSKW